MHIKSFLQKCCKKFRVTPPTSSSFFWVCLPPASRQSRGISPTNLPQKKKLVIAPENRALFLEESLPRFWSNLCLKTQLAIPHALIERATFKVRQPGSKKSSGRGIGNFCGGLTDFFCFSFELVRNFKNSSAEKEGKDESLNGTQEMLCVIGARFAYFEGTNAELTVYLGFLCKKYHRNFSSKN